MPAALFTPLPVNVTGPVSPFVLTDVPETSVYVVPLASVEFVRKMLLLDPERLIAPPEETDMLPAVSMESLLEPFRLTGPTASEPVVAVLEKTAVAPPAPCNTRLAVPRLAAAREPPLMVQVPMLLEPEPIETMPLATTRLVIVVLPLISVEPTERFVKAARFNVPLTVKVRLADELVKTMLPFVTDPLSVVEFAIVIVGDPPLRSMLPPKKHEFPKPPKVALPRMRMSLVMVSLPPLIVPDWPRVALVFRTTVDCPSANRLLR